MKSPVTHLLISVAFAVTAFALYGIWYSYIASVSARVAALQSEIDAKTEAAGRLATARTALSEITDSELKVQNYFVSQNSIVRFINDLEQRARSQGATIAVGSVATGGPPTQPILTLIFSIKGDFDDVLRTIGVIEYAPYHLTITKLALALQESEDRSVWNADVTIVVGSVAASASSQPTASTSPRKP